MRKLIGLAAASAVVLAACGGTPESTETPVVEDTANAKTSVCSKEYVNNNPNWMTQKVGTQIAADPAQQDVSGLYTWQRVLYVGTLADSTDKVPVCGTVYKPTAGWTSGKMVAWTHGTVGLRPDCQPSHKEFSLAQAPDKGGIGTGLTELMQRGVMVVATDYYSGLGDFPYQTYANGVVEGRNTLEMVAAVNRENGNKPVQYAVWGHSQGGGASLWAGQLADKYMPTIGGGIDYRLVGVIGAAPASQFAYNPYVDRYKGASLGDRNEYNYIAINGVNAVPIGDILFSYVTVSWSALSDRIAKRNRGAFPADPTGVGQPSRLDAIATSKAIPVATDVANKFCLNVHDAASISALVKALAVFNRDATAPQPFFAPPWQGDFNPKKVVNSTPGIDSTCANPGTGQNLQWCKSLWFQMPGPYGRNDYDKTPQYQGQDVPVFLAQGTRDNIIWCMPPDQAQVAAEDCLTKQVMQSVEGNAAWTAKYYKDANHFQVMVDSLPDSMAFLRDVLGIQVA